MKELIINGRAYPSIWRDENAPKQEKAVTKCRGLAYKDPTANAALGNIEREEKLKKRMEQQAAKRKRPKKRHKKTVS